MDDQAVQLLNALEDERRYVARELHDSVAQTTLQLGLQAGICRKLLERGNMEMLARELANLEERIQVASRQVREMISDMRPPLVEPEASLVDYLKHEIEIHQQRGGPQVTSQLQKSDQLARLSQTEILALARIVQEALFNIRKHAKAAHVYLSLKVEGGEICLTLADDGKGVNPTEVAAPPTDKGGAGIANLRRRVEAIGGLLEITPGASGGTQIIVRIPQ
jgi:two-component system, NarL family, sensor histidine kinase DegS